MNTNDNIKMTGELMIEIHDAKTGKLKSRDIVKNLIVTAAKNAVALGLSGQGSGSGAGQITYCAVGTSNTTPVVGDTSLNAELYRKLVSVRSVNNNVAQFQTFYNQNEANGTLKEAGLFGDAATTTPGSGTLYAHTLIDRTKSSSDTLTLTWSVTVN